MPAGNPQQWPVYSVFNDGAGSPGQPSVRRSCVEDQPCQLITEAPFIQRLETDVSLCFSSPVGNAGNAKQLFLLAACDDDGHPVNLLSAIGDGGQKFSIPVKTDWPVYPKLSAIVLSESLAGSLPLPPDGHVGRCGRVRVLPHGLDGGTNDERRTSAADVGTV